MATILTKPTISFQEQISLLEERQLIIRDKAFALQYLQRNSYYHLNIYFKQRQQNTGFVDNNGKPMMVFFPGTTFEDIVRTHENDCRLRGFTQQLLQPIEIRLRTIISYHLGKKLGSLVFYEDGPYYSMSRINNLRDRFEELILADSSNPIVQHHLMNYAGKFPLYAILELTSFSFLKNFFSSLTYSYQDQIARYFGQKNSHSLMNWMGCISDLRNICAHHNYLHRRLFDATPTFIDDQILERGQRKTLFAYFVVMGYLSAPKFWKEVLDELEQYNNRTDCLQISSYGFSQDWKKKLIEGVKHF